MFLRTIGSAPDEEHLMLQFIPFEDDWDALERLRPEDLIPYRVGLLPEPAEAEAVSVSTHTRSAMTLPTPAATSAALAWNAGSSGA